MAVSSLVQVQFSGYCYLKMQESKAPTKFMKDTDKLVRKMVKGKKNPAPEKPMEPQITVEWLKKAYGAADPSDGAPKVGNIGYI